MSHGSTDLPALLHPFARPAAARDEFVNIVAAAGAEILDDRGHRYVDALASLWYCNVGHGDARIIEAVTSQMRRLDAFHSFDRYTNPTADALAYRLARVAPFQDARVFLTSGGSEAVETAIKLARLAQSRAGYAGRTVVISRAPSYHGVTYAAMSATGLPINHFGFGPLLQDVIQVPDGDLAALDAQRDALDGRIAAVLAEPVIGAGGVHPPGPGYLNGLRERCDAWGAFLIFDEIVCGFGRLGQWWGGSHFGVQPDIVTFAKGVTSGYLPLGGVLISPAVRGPLEADAEFVLHHGFTFSGHPTAAAAALANLDILEADGLFSHAEVIAQSLEQGFRSLVDGDAVVSVRGTGGIWALGLGEWLHASALRDALMNQGVIARPLGTSTLAFCPPLVISTQQLDRCVDGLAEALRTLSR